MTFNPPEKAACQKLVQMALFEDLHGVTDLTSELVIPAELQGKAVFVARAEGVLAGLQAAEMVVGAVDLSLRFEPLIADGSRLEAGKKLALVSGPMRSLLTAERTALNFLQRLSGVATQTRRYVDAVVGLKAKILDTRKTTPGWRLLEKYAVRQGGGQNHRIGLFDHILIKDNHLAALNSLPEGKAIERAVELARKAVGSSVPVEVEVDTLDQLNLALAAKPDIILLDNMCPDLLHEGVRRRNEQAPAVILEASGGVDLQTVRAIAESGVDWISVGALTHSAPALDIALDYLA